MSDMRTGDSTQLLTLSLLLVMTILGGCLFSTKPTGPQEDHRKSSTDTNNAPTISGSPDTSVLVGDFYSFTPSANDPDGDELSFSIRNRPRWAVFDNASGRLNGQALLGDQGVYDQIEISVADRTSKFSLRPFSITVTDTALGSMTLSWTPPTDNTDGTTLSDLAGYNIYFGTNQGDYPNQIRIENPSINRYHIENLVPDTYYVVATSYNSMGIESYDSGVAVKTVSAN
jgi:hypothetical protein